MTLTTRISWARIVDIRPPVGLEDEEASSCYLSKIFHFSARRNAYWGSWSFSTFGDSSFSPREDDLKARIDGIRKQGKQFLFAELPSIAIRGTSFEVYILQPSSDHPFEKAARAPIAGRGVFEIAKSIQKSDRRTVMFLNQAKEPNLAILPFACFSSYSRGANYPLEWSWEDRAFDLTSTMQLLANLTIHLNCA